MTVIWSRHARDRLNAILEFIGADSVTRASEFCDRLIDAADRLKSHPFSGPVLPEDSAYRQLVSNEYRIVYEVDDRVRSIDVTRIAHRREVYD